jgi:hypothetical protein
MRFELAMSLRSHGSRNNAMSLHLSIVKDMIIIYLSLGGPNRWEHRKKRSDMLGGSQSRMWYGCRMR